MKEFNERQIEKIKLLGEIAGSIKTDYKVDAVETINQLRGKSSEKQFTEEQFELMEIIKRTAGSVTFSHDFDSVESIKNLRRGIWAVPESTKPQQLYDTVIQFMKDQDVTCEETIHQCDWVIENAYDFITDLFNIVKDDLNLEEDE